MVPTTVERLREGQGVRERVLRSIKMEKINTAGNSSLEEEYGEKAFQTRKLSSQLKRYCCAKAHQLDLSDTDRCEMQATSIASPMKSPHRYSPSVYLHQVAYCYQYFLLINYNNCYIHL